ncbi:MAG TPA: YbjN domain-containing protein [Caulobacteraceae bacterium]|nr:YbjN domain-containing protein [Caulobacteraceae bacterium]
MDIPHPEEDDVLVTLDPLEVVEHVLHAERLDFDRTEDGDLAFSLKGDWKDYELWFAWRPEAECLQLFLSIDMRAAGARAAAETLANLINQRVWLGHFEIWTGEGEVVFRHALPLPSGERPSLAQTASMIDAAMEAADRFYPAFDFLIREGRAPADAMAACMFETLGQA